MCSCVWLRLTRGTEVPKELAQVVSALEVIGLEIMSANGLLTVRSHDIYTGSAIQRIEQSDQFSGVE